MAQIVINEYSANYSYNIGTSSYATVALPITACWGPGYFDPATMFTTTATVTGSNGNTVIGSNSNTVIGVVPVSDEAQERQSVEARQKMLEQTVWQRFPATQAGLESFMSTYRGPSSCYRAAKDFSYQMAVTLLTAGYDILTCRLCPGNSADGKLAQDNTTAGTTATATFQAKYPGTFGNNLQITMRKSSYYDTEKRDRVYFWNVITYVVDASGTRSSVESKSFVTNTQNASDTVLYYKDVESDFWTVDVDGPFIEDANSEVPYDPDVYAATFDPVANTGTKQNYTRLQHGTDYQDGVDSAGGSEIYTASDIINGNDQTGPRISISELAKGRYQWEKDYQLGSDDYCYPDTIKRLIATDPQTEGQPWVSKIDNYTARILYYREWLFTSLVGTDADDPDDPKHNLGGVYDLLKDKLTYNPQRIISPGWDDQDLTMYTDDLSDIYTVGTYEDPAVHNTCTATISPMHAKIMEVAYYSRCATGFIDVPKIVDRRYVHIEDEFDANREGYIQKLARLESKDSGYDVNGTLFQTHSAFFAPWGQFTYTGTSKLNEASPSFLTLMIQRAQILNQPIQYEWALPTDRKHNLRIGKMEYTVPKKVLDKWQKLEGASVNVITTIPDLGTNLWGNSTLYEVPPATYQALANLSTRYLVNAVEDVAYKCGISITFQYNNDQAYNKFYAGVTPLLDTMRNVGAIEDYRVTMSADINGEDHVNANSVIGKIWLIVNGVINDIYVDLIALPAGLGIDLNSLV